MGGKVAGDGDQNVSARVAVAPFAELPHACLKHLVGVEARVLTQQSLRQSRDQCVRRVAQCEMARNQTGGCVNLMLPIECRQQSVAQAVDIIWKVVEAIRLRRAAVLAAR
jgi:hypothetical protein